MYTGLYAAVSGSMVQEKRLAILTNNLANTATVGFKADKPVFQVTPLPAVVGPHLLPQTAQLVVSSLDPFTGQDSPQIGLMHLHTDFAQGPIRESGNPLDLALEGRGFFVVAGPGSEAYTRQGIFTINADGLLVTPAGFLVQGESGPLYVGKGRVEIDATGRVMVNEKVIDRLRLVDFPQPYPLEKMGNALFRVAAPAPPPPEPANPTVRQGALELSNADPIRLLVSVIETSRAFEAYQKVLQAFDETADRAVNDLARSG